MAINLGIYASAFSPPTTNTAAPVASYTGTGAAGGSTLSVTTGTWTPAPSSFAYQWQRLISGVWTSESGATSSSFTPNNNSGGSWRALVLASTPGGAVTTAISNTIALTQPPPVNTSAPVLTSSGNGNAGTTTLTLSSYGTWSPLATSYAIQWQPDTYPIDDVWVGLSDVTSLSYTPPSSQGGNYRVRVIGSNVGGDGVSYTNTIELMQLPPSSTSAPVAGGSGGVGTQRTVTNNGSWSPPATSYSYKWQRQISDADPTTFVDASSAAGWTTPTVTTNGTGYWRCQVSATNAGGTGVAYTNSVLVPGPPYNIQQPGLNVDGAETDASTRIRVVNYPSYWAYNPDVFYYEWQLYNGGTWARASQAPFDTGPEWAPSVPRPYTVRCLVKAANPYGTSDWVPSTQLSM